MPVPPLSTETITCIDLHNISERRDQVVHQLMDAATSIGFFQVIGHGFTAEELDEAFTTSRSFLDAPDELKKRYQGDDDNKSYAWGWKERGYDAGVLRSGMFTGFETKRMKPYWPTQEDCPDFKAKILSFMHRCHAVALAIMQCFAIGLGLPEDFFDEAMDPAAADNATGMYLNHYPATTGRTFPEGALRIAAHTDFELLTLLFQRAGEPGLELCAGKGLTPSDAMTKGLWVPCDPKPGAITINIGDALQYWSDDRLRSTFHRVRVPRPHEYQGDRYSIAYFANARDSTVFQGPAKKYPPITFPQILEQKRKNYPEQLKGKNKLTDEEQLSLQLKAHGPEFLMAEQ